MKVRDQWITDWWTTWVALLAITIYSLPASSCTTRLPVSCLAAKPIKRGNTSKDMHGMIRHMNSILAFSETILKEMESFL